MFTHLHNHTEYSMLDGLSRLQPLIQHTNELGMEALAITDHGGLYGAIDFYRKAQDEGIRPIVGCEMYVAPDSRHDRNSSDRNPYHLTVLAKDFGGYQNLVKLVTASHLEGFYYRPRVDRELLQQHHDGLVVLSGCPSGEVPTLIAQGRTEEAQASAAWCRDVFGDYYLEFMRHGDVPEGEAINRGLWNIHDELGIPVVATNDSHYINEQDARLQDILICIQTNTNVHDDKRLRMAEPSYYLKSPDQMAQLFKDLPQGISNTQVIADMCDLHLDFTQFRMPKYETPGGASPFEFLEQLCWAGLSERIPKAGTAERERLQYELEVIRQTSFDNYFLVVWDIAKFVRARDIFFAVRGSAAASLVLYCLGVTNVNPLPYGLVFERFLNLERKEMPDIDMDFQDDRREEVINYVTAKYGREHVANIITFGTLGARAAIRDVGRALAMSYSDVDRVARMLPIGANHTLAEAKIDPELELGSAVATDEAVRNLVETAEALEGTTRHFSTHAAGVVISQEPLSDVVPLQRPPKSDQDDSVNLITQYSMDPVAALGLLKMDFLGLVNLTVLAKARNLIAQTRDEHIELAAIPLTDQRTFALLSAGDTAGIFQLEGAGMTRSIRQLMPTSLEEIAAMIALYRPGPMDHIATFVDAKHGRAPVKYLHPDLQEILEETYGVIVYQDQVLQIARRFAGYTLGEADVVRKAMGKKIPKVMAQEREKFLAGAANQGFDAKLAARVFALIEPFAGYAFNKAHAVSYGLISYWTAYLKANYTPEYMTALLNSYAGQTDRVKSAVAECYRLQIAVLPPSITVGRTEFTLEQQSDNSPAIRFGMGAIKNVGAAAVVELVASRERIGGFESIEQMCREANLSGINRRTLECLIKVGAFDDFGDRAGLLDSADRIIALAHSETKRRGSNQGSMFDLFGEYEAAALTELSQSDLSATEREKGEWEHELLGVALSSKKAFAKILSGVGSDHIVFLSAIDESMAGQPISLVGRIVSTTERLTRQAKPFLIAGLALMDDQLEVFVWQELLDDNRNLWTEGQTLVIQGVVRVRDQQISVSATHVQPYTQDIDRRLAGSTHSETPVTPTVPDDPGRSGDTQSPNNLRDLQPTRTADARLTLRIIESEDPVHDQMLLDDIKRTLLDHAGPDRVILEIAAQGQLYRLDWTTVQVNACQELTSKLEHMLGSTGSVSLH